MPLAATSPHHLNRYFEHNAGHPGTGDHCLHFDDNGVVGRYGQIHLHSAFQPLLEAHSLHPVAHEALLRARLADGRVLSPAQAFQAPKTADGIIFLDRLCRTVHAFNFATQAEAGDVLYLNVDGRHLLNVEGGTHGRAFETLLAHCGLAPENIVLEILESDIADETRLIQAVAAYQARGYRIAIDDFGCSHSNFDRLWKLSPDIVKLDRGLIVQSATNARARTILPKLVDMLHDLGARVVCEGIETREQHDLVLAAGTDLVQGFLYARPQPRLHRVPGEDALLAAQ